MCSNPASIYHVSVGQACSAGTTCCPDNQLACVDGVCTAYCDTASDPGCDFCLTASGASCSEGMNFTSAALAGFAPALSLTPQPALSAVAG